MHAAVAQSLLVRRGSSLVPWVIVSVAAHGVVVGGLIALAVLNLLGGPAPIDLDQKPITASLVRLGKERDQKLLPRKEEEPPPPQEVKATTPPPPTPAEPPKNVETVPVPGLKPPPPQAKQAGEKTEQPHKSLASAFSKFAAKAPEQELEGAADGDPNGDSATQEGERYYGALKAGIRRYYDVSSTISEQERMHLRAELLIRIGTRGELLEAPRLAKPSGNDLFDSAVVAAAKKAAPFGPPPDHLRQELSGRGIILEFTP